MEIDRRLYGPSLRSRVGVRAAAATVLYLTGGLVVGFIAAIALDNIPIHIDEPLSITLAAVLFFAVMSFFSLRWARTMASISGIEARPRAVRVAGLSYPLVLTLTALALGAGEALFNLGIPIHVLFALLFVPAVMFVVAVVSVAWGVALKGWGLGAQLALRAAPLAGLGFFLVYLVMDAIGYRVGGPGAAERATMITVTFVGCLAAATVGGAALGAGLKRFATQS